MPAKRVNIRKDEFQKVVNYLENHYLFRSPTALWNAVSDSEWARGLERGLSPRTFSDRARELGIIYDTRLRRQRSKDVRIRRTNRVDYLYRITFTQKGMKGIQCRDLRVGHRIVTKDDIDKVEMILKGKLLSHIKIKDD